MTKDFHSSLRTNYEMNKLLFIFLDVFWNIFEYLALFGARYYILVLYIWQELNLLVKYICIHFIY